MMNLYVFSLSRTQNWRKRAIPSLLQHQNLCFQAEQKTFRAARLCGRISPRIPRPRCTFPRFSFLSFFRFVLHAPSLLVDAREPASNGEQLRADNADEQNHLEHGQPLRARVGALGGCEQL